MRKRNVFLAGLAVVAVAAVVLAGGLMASNMGFKLNLTLEGSSSGTSASGTNFIALPFNQQVGLNNARDVFSDIGGSIISISQHRKDNDAFEFYSASFNTNPPNGFPLVPGEAYIVRNTTAAEQYIVVGSHDPGLSIGLIAAGGASASGTNFYGHPYHGVAATARDLFSEIGGSIISISQHRHDNDAFEFYSASFNTDPPNGFLLGAGEGYIVRVGSDEAFTPAHF